MKNFIYELPCDVGDKMFAIVNKGTPYEEIKQGSVKEIAKDRKGWHIHFNGTRYNINAIGRLLFLNLEDALENSNKDAHNIKRLLNKSE